jgi:hypothetical protein
MIFYTAAAIMSSFLVNLVDYQIAKLVMVFSVVK